MESGDESPAQSKMEIEKEKMEKSKATMNRRTPKGYDRRAILKCAAGLGLSFALPGLDVLAARRRGTERLKSLLVVWLSGGPSQLETWDPHPGTTVGGPTRSITTSIAGVEIAESYPQIAEQLHRLSIVRS